MKNVKNVSPGYLLLEPYELKRKVGAFSVAVDEENAPELGKVIKVGPEVNKMPYDKQYLPEVGDVVMYKRYNANKISMGTKETILVHFENVLGTLEADDV